PWRVTASSTALVAPVQPPVHVRNVEPTYALLDVRSPHLVAREKECGQNRDNELHPASRPFDPPGCNSDSLRTESSPRPRSWNSLRRHARPAERHYRRRGGDRWAEHE